MTKSTVFVNPNLIAQESIGSLPQVTNVEWKGHCFLLNGFPKLIVHADYAEELPATAPSVAIVCPRRGRVALKISLFDRPQEERWVGVRGRNPEEVNWRRVKSHKLADGSVRPLEKVKIRSDGKSGFDEILNFVRAMGSREAAELLYGLVTETEIRKDYTIPADNAFFSEKFDRLALGNPAMASVGFQVARVATKFRWFEALAWLNWSLACLENVNQHIESTLVRGGTTSVHVNCLQDLLGQFVRKNVKQSMEVTLEVLPGGLPSNHQCYKSVDETRRRVGPSR